MLFRSSLTTLIAAQDMAVETWTVNDLEVDQTKLGLKGSPTRVKKIFGPPPRERGEILTETAPEPGAAAGLLMDRLQDRGLIFGGMPDGR